MIRRGHLRLVPRPLAKPAPYPVRGDGVELSRDGEGGYILSVQRDGRIVELPLSRDMLAVFLFKASEVIAGER